MLIRISQSRAMERKRTSSSKEMINHNKGIYCNQLQPYANEQSRNLGNNLSQGTTQISKDPHVSEKQTKNQDMGSNVHQNFQINQSQIPKLTSNFEKHNQPHPENRTGGQIPNVQNNNTPQTSQNHQNTSKKEQIPAPAPFTVTQSFAAKLRLNQAQNERPIGLAAHDFTSRQEGQLMRIQTWTQTVKPEEETPIVPVWIALPKLPWHCYSKEFVFILLQPIGKVLYFDSATVRKTRGSIAKVKVQIDLTKERPPHIWMGIDEDDYNIGRWQTIEYENVPDYCMYCRHQGHHEQDCNIKRREEEHKRRKEIENEK
ncbi:hypothetical protein KY290_001081 [Solanum tuberosum]|uniref:DUF4283 domain-containing protein n=1 Tax=Solanum tuberosum TaxID=4113 RepID=A0ABQ7WN18_SOLTU|nr:hypothetical protein KY290_001081 [Solanum tuberosum]